MAAQPPEPFFQPSGQDESLTQGRPAWQQQHPSRNPPSGAPGGQQAYAAQDQTYTVGPGQDYQDYQNYQGYQSAGYGAQQGQGQSQGQSTGAGAPPQWQASAGAPHGTPRARQQAGKGFIGALFDFSFSTMVTPKIIKGLYVLAVAWTGLLALIYVVIGFDFGGFGGALAVLVLIAPIMLLLGIGLSRVVLEAFMLAFKIHEELKAIREQGEKQA